jgi:hypothetical protein
MKPQKLPIFLNIYAILLVVFSIMIEFSSVVEIMATLSMYKNALSNLIDFQQNSFVRNKSTKLHPCGWKMLHVCNPMQTKFLASQMCERKKTPFTKFATIPMQV